MRRCGSGRCREWRKNRSVRGRVARRVQLLTRSAFQADFEAFPYNVSQHQPSPISPTSLPLRPPTIHPPARCRTTRVAKSPVTASNTPPVAALSAQVSDISPFRLPSRALPSSPCFTRRLRVIGPKPYVRFRWLWLSIISHVYTDARAHPLARASCALVR